MEILLLVLILLAITGTLGDAIVFVLKVAGMLGVVFIVFLFLHVMVTAG